MSVEKSAELIGIPPSAPGFMTLCKQVAETVAAIQLDNYKTGVFTVPWTDNESNVMIVIRFKEPRFFGQDFEAQYEANSSQTEAELMNDVQGRLISVLGNIAGQCKMYSAMPDVTPLDESEE